VVESDTEASEELVTYSRVWRFEPEGPKFEVPVEVTILYSGDPEHPALFWSHGGGPFEVLPGTESGSVVVLSDEDDYSVLPEAQPDPFAAWLLGLKTDPVTATFSAIVGPEEPCDDAFETGATYLDVVEATGGMAASICEDFGDPLEEIASVAAHYGVFELTRVPVVSSIGVVVREGRSTYDLVEGVDWSYSEADNAVTSMTFGPPGGATVEVCCVPRI